MIRRAECAAPFHCPATARRGFRIFLPPVVLYGMLDYGLQIKKYRDVIWLAERTRNERLAETTHRLRVVQDLGKRQVLGLGASAIIWLGGIGRFRPDISCRSNTTGTVSRQRCLCWHVFCSHTHPRIPAPGAPPTRPTTHGVKEWRTMVSQIWRRSRRVCTTRSRETGWQIPFRSFTIPRTQLYRSTTPRPWQMISTSPNSSPTR